MARFKYKNNIHGVFQSTIIVFTRNASSHKTDWFISELPLLALSCPFISQTEESNKCTWRRISLPFRNLYKCKQVTCNVVVACLLLNRLFTQMLLLYSGLFADHVNKPIILIFKAFVYHFKNIIPILVTIRMLCMGESFD